MNGGKRHPLIAGAWIVGLGTMVSRLLGMLRDMATAALLGMSGSSVMDAFVLAFRIPNLFRRLFGEGALAASYLPVLSEELERDRRSAWQLASVTMVGLAVLLVALVLLLEAALGGIWLLLGDRPRVEILVGLAAVLMPYMIFICLAAQVAATLHVLGHFTVPALVPTLLNICWLIGAWGFAPWLAPDDPQGQAYILAVAILTAGVLQFGLQLPVLRRLGFRFEWNWAASRAAVSRVVRSMGPMVIGLAITQINTLLDSMLAWALSRMPDGPTHVAWLGGVEYPMQQGAAAAVYYGERLYQFPLGILGLAVATSIFPLLSRHAARGQTKELAGDLSLGLQLVLLLGVPAGVGLVLLAEPLARLLFERGRFGPEDTLRTARMIACYGAGVWAYCALPVIVRGYYALGDRTTPVRLGAAIVGLNLTLNLVLIWPLAEAGLAVATSVAASIQVLLLVAIFSRSKASLQWSALAATAARSVAATAVMGLACAGVLAAMPPAPGLGRQALRVLLPLLAAAAVYLASYRLLGGRELSVLLRGRDRTEA